MNPNPVCRADQGEVFEQTWGRIVWSASQKLGNSRRMTFGRVKLRTGGGSPRHRHPNCDEILHVISGRLEHTLGDERFVMEAGDTISIPTGVWHGATVLGEGDADLVICFSSADRQTELEE